MSQERVQRRLAAILFADVVGYSRLTGQDEVGTWRRLQNVLRDVVPPHIKAHAGRVVRIKGDGILVEFASAVEAVVSGVVRVDAGLSSAFPGIRIGSGNSNGARRRAPGSVLYPRTDVLI